MPRIRFARAALILAAAIIVGNGCTNSTEPTTGSLQVTVSGLPSAAAAAITVTRPSRFDQVVTATITLSALEPGPYTITAANVTNVGVIYVASPPSQDVSMQVSLTAATTAGYVRSVEAYDPSTNTWVTKASLPTSRPNWPRASSTASSLR